MTDETLDQILALQVTIAWAGEGLCDPNRLGWWNTDLVDQTAPHGEDHDFVAYMREVALRRRAAGDAGRLFP